MLVSHRHRNAQPWLANSEASRDDDRKFLIPLEQYLSACHRIVDGRYDHQSQHCVDTTATAECGAAAAVAEN